MNCRFVQSRLSAYVDCELTGNEQQAIRAHLEHCLECSREYETLRKTKSLIRQLPVVQPTTSPEWLLMRIRQNSAPSRSTRWSWKQVRWWHFAGGMALVSAFIVWDTRSNNTDPLSTATVSSPALASQPISRSEPNYPPALNSVSGLPVSPPFSSPFQSNSSPYLPTNSYWSSTAAPYSINQWQMTGGFQPAFGLSPR